MLNSFSPSKALKQNNGGGSPSKEMRRLRIQLSDRNFELKKMQQDYAQDKAHFLMKYNSQKVNLKKIIQQLRQKIVQQNQHWTYKIDEIRKQNENQIIQINGRWKGKINMQINLIKQKLEEQYRQEINDLKTRLKDKQQKIKQDDKKHEQYKLRLQERQKKKLQQCRQSYQLKISQTLRNNKKQEQCKINTVNLARNIEQKKHKQTKQLLNRKQQVFKQTIKKYQSIIVTNKQQNKVLSNKVCQLQSQNKSLNQKITQIINQNIDVLKTKQNEYSQDMKKIQNEWKQNIQSLNDRWKIQYKKIQQSVQKIQNACIQKQKTWQQRGKKVLQLYQKRQSKQQDVKIIQHLQVQLIRKQFQLKRQKQQLKTCKLELDNMDQIYKRIFYSAQKNHKQSSSFHSKKIKLPGLLSKSTNPVKITHDN